MKVKSLIKQLSALPKDCVITNYEISLASKNGVQFLAHTIPSNEPREPNKDLVIKGFSAD